MAIKANRAAKLIIILRVTVETMGEEKNDGSGRQLKHSGSIRSTIKGSILLVKCAR